MNPSDVQRRLREAPTSEVSAMSGVPRRTLDRWKAKLPDPVLSFIAVLNAIDLISPKKAKAASGNPERRVDDVLAAKVPAETDRRRATKLAKLAARGDL
jgi:hypothetical protein